MANDGEPERRLLVSRVRIVVSLLTVAILAAAGIILVRVTGGNAVKIGGVEIDVPLYFVPIFFVVVTILHIFWAGFISFAVGSVDWNAPPDSKEKVIQELREQRSWLLNGMLPRRRTQYTALFIMDPRDSTTWVFIGSALVALVAMLPWLRSPDGFTWIGSTGRVVSVSGFSLALVAFNWVIGSTWVVSITELTVPSMGQRWLDEPWFFLSTVPGPGYTNATFFALCAAIIGIPVLLVLSVVGIIFWR
jgi:hypothetical protein